MKRRKARGAGSRRPGHRASTAGRAAGPEPVRLQKYISQAGVASRRQAEGLMREGRIHVNGVPATEMGIRVTPGRDTVSLDGRVVEPARRRWIVFHKPSGVLCTRHDPHGGRTVYDCLPGWVAGLRYVGRLDRDTSGLLLLTNDGDLAASPGSRGRSPQGTFGRSGAAPSWRTGLRVPAVFAGSRRTATGAASMWSSRRDGSAKCGAS